jgi:hypothetical protein
MNDGGEHTWLFGKSGPIDAETNNTGMKLSSKDQNQQLEREVVLPIKCMHVEFGVIFSRIYFQTLPIAQPLIMLQRKRVCNFKHD